MLSQTQYPQTQHPYPQQWAPVAQPQRSSHRVVLSVTAILVMICTVVVVILLTTRGTTPAPAQQSGALGQAQQQNQQQGQAQQNQNQPPVQQPPVQQPPVQQAQNQQGQNQQQPEDQVSAMQADTRSMSPQQVAVAWVTAFNYQDAQTFVSVSCRVDIASYLQQGAMPSNSGGGVVLDVGAVTPSGDHAWLEVTRGGSSANGQLSRLTAMMVQQNGWKVCMTSADPNNA
ncbi:hypothetical protein [Nakamurella alba]|uniref:hypothetical protein n=1 Tax=Nakamurella alba TaxID=2665158 RepID=UPI0018A9F128|nr:hypothetical protein [Nakamurella alba]